MTLHSSRLVMIVAAAAALSGCQSIFGLSLRGHARSVPIEAGKSELANATSAGRSYLDAGQTGLAIASFQQALAANEPSAPALNGLGVAYARLGRYDVAERLFQEAMAIDPSDGRYAGNLATLMSSPVLAMRHDGDIADQVRGAAMPVSNSPQARASTAPADGKLVRVSASEYHIVTVIPPARAGQPATLALSSRFHPIARFPIAGSLSNAAGSRTATVDPRFRPLVRVELRDKQSADATMDGLVVNPYVSPTRSAGKRLPKIMYVSTANVSAQVNREGLDL